MDKIVVQAEVIFKYDSRYVFGTARYTNKGLVIISPIYMDDINLNDLVISDLDGPLKLKETHIKTDWEQIKLNVYECTSYPDSLICRYKGVETTIYPISNKQPNCKLSAMTIFRDDEDLLTKWISHHHHIGVESFYLYWNGKLTDDVKDRLYSKVPNHLIDIVHFIGFDVPYWQTSGLNKSPHLGQTLALSDFLWWSKDFCDYALFCDLDEFVFLHEDISLEKYDSTTFMNKFCGTFPISSYKDISDSNIFAEERTHQDRYKSIHNVNRILLAGPHCSNKHMDDFTNIEVSYDRAELFHVIKFNERDRSSLLGCGDFKRHIDLSKSKKIIK